MVDHDKQDGTSTMTGRPNRPEGFGAGTQGSAQQQAGERSASGTSSESSGRTAEQAKRYAEQMAGRAKERGRSMFEQQKDNAARQLDSVARAIRNSSGQLEGEGQRQSSRYVDMTADRLEQFGRVLREKNVDTLIADAENLGRRAPGALFAGTAVAGFLLARFLKSSAERRREQTDRDASYDTDRYEVATDSTIAEAYRTTGSSGRNGASTVATGMGSSVTGGASSAAGASGTIETFGTVAPTSSSTESKPGGNIHGNR